MSRESAALVHHGLDAHRRGDLIAAGSAYESALQADPADADAHNLLGAIAFSRREFVTAERFFDAAIAYAPALDGARFNRGRVREALGRPAEALCDYAAVSPQADIAADAAIRTGSIHVEAGDFAAAAAALQRALALRPDRPGLAVDLAVAEIELGRMNDAAAHLEAALALNPADIRARVALVHVRRASGDLAAADRIVEALLADAPAEPLAWLGRGRVRYDRGELEGAEHDFRRAAELAPGRHEPYTNLNVVAHAAGRLADAIAHGEAAIARAPADAEAHLNLGMSYLMAGDFARGWPNFEYRLARPSARAADVYRDRLPRLAETTPAGSRVLVARDQGAGDFIAFSRFFPRLTARGLDVAVECPPGLEPLYAASADLAAVFGGRSDPARAAGMDAYVPLGSVPMSTGVTDLLRDGAAVPYLAADRRRVAAFRTRLEPAPGRLKVGIAWAGSAAHASDRHRSCGLAAFAPLADLPQIDWYALQTGERAFEPAPPGLALQRLEPVLTDYGDTAAALALLDMLIAVDTSVVHLAGALGRPVWTLLGFETYWLWGAHGETTPWYPTMRLFRQSSYGDWPGVFTRVRAALSELLTIQAIGLHD